MSGEGKVFILSSVKDTRHTQSFSLFFLLCLLVAAKANTAMTKETPMLHIRILLICCVKMLIWCKIILTICYEKNNFKKLWLKVVVSEHFLGDLISFILVYGCSQFFLYVLITYVFGITYLFAGYLICFRI